MRQHANWNDSSRRNLDQVCVCVCVCVVCAVDGKKIKSWKKIEDSKNGVFLICVHYSHLRVK